MVIINAFNVYGKVPSEEAERILRWLGLSHYGFLEEKSDMLATGQKLIEQRRNERERDFERLSASVRVYSAKSYIEALDAREEGRGPAERLRQDSEGSDKGATAGGGGDFFK